jgi:hypothetical protein
MVIWEGAHSPSVFLRFRYFQYITPKMANNTSAEETVMAMICKDVVDTPDCWLGASGTAGVEVIAAGGCKESDAGLLDEPGKSMVDDVLGSWVVVGTCRTKARDVLVTWVGLGLGVREVTLVDVLATGWAALGQEVGAKVESRSPD